MIHSPLKIGTLTLAHRLIQGPLAGFSAAPMRERFTDYIKPAYCVSEMLSATDVINKHQANQRYLYRSAREGLLCYQIAGQDPQTLAAAAKRLADLGADLIDLNCGCPKAKIRKKGAGSALLDSKERLKNIVMQIRDAIHIPFTVKIRLQDHETNLELASMLETAGADALIVHGRRWTDDYEQAADWAAIAQIKQAIDIPVIANGDIKDKTTLEQAINMSACDAYMISRAGTGKPWLYQDLLTETTTIHSIDERIEIFMAHLEALTVLESEHQAVLQSKTLVRYYFREYRQPDFLQAYYAQNALKQIRKHLKQWSISQT